MNTSKDDAAEFDEERDALNWETGVGILNRTGIATSPEMALDMIREAQATPPHPKGDASQLAEYRKPYLEERSILGSRPLPKNTDSGQGGDAVGPLLLDKLGERLAFERQGVRLYECLIGKVKALGAMPGGPSVKDLEHILKEEKQHFQFLQQAIVQSGGDPTVQTPCADVAGVLSQGVVQIVADPRTTVVQSLEAMLTAELVDNDGWAMLRDLVDAVDAADWAEKIETAQANEEEHLEKVRGWLSTLILGELPSGRGGDLDREALEVGEAAASEDGASSSPQRRKRKPGTKAEGKPSRPATGSRKRKT